MSKTKNPNKRRKANEEEKCNQKAEEALRFCTCRIGIPFCLDWSLSRRRTEKNFAGFSSLASWCFAFCKWIGNWDAGNSTRLLLSGGVPEKSHVISSPPTFSIVFSSLAVLREFQRRAFDADVNDFEESILESKSAWGKVNWLKPEGFTRSWLRNQDDYRSWLNVDHEKETKSEKNLPLKVKRNNVRKFTWCTAGETSLRRISNT